MDVLKNKCKYQSVVVDTYWNPGSDNGRPELFTPAFRLDLFFLDYQKGLRNHDGVSLEEQFGELPDNLQTMWNGSESGSYKKRVRAVWP